MSLLMKAVVPVLLIFSLAACKDVLNKPLGGMEAPASMEQLDGSWVAEEGGARLDILKTSTTDWYGFSYQEQGKQMEGRFVVAYFKRKRVLNIDLASVKVNGVPVVKDSSQAFLMVDATVDDEQLLLTPADMDKFEKHFAQYFFASPIQVEGLCKKDNELCTSTFSSGNVLISKRMRKFNDELIKKYRTVFPYKKQVVFNPAKSSSER
ncbi:MAG TPA: hypothetical protein VGE32_12335 [Cellvibrio sp.]